MQPFIDLFSIIVTLVVSVGCLIPGMVATAVILCSSPVKVVDQEGFPPIMTIALVILLTPITLLCIFAGAWFLGDILLLLLGMILGMPICIYYAEYLDTLKAILCTPQRPRKRKRVYPSYPKHERMQEQPMGYYEEMKQRY